MGGSYRRHETHDHRVVRLRRILHREEPALERTGASVVAIATEMSTSSSRAAMLVSSPTRISAVIRPTSCGSSFPLLSALDIVLLYIPYP
jgi:hypothetical protein